MGYCIIEDKNTKCRINFPGILSMLYSDGLNNYANKQIYNMLNYSNHRCL